MARVAKQTGLILAIGHQRHYNILYANAVDAIRQGLLGEVHYIRAQWHRGNMPGNDSWQPPLPPRRKAERSPRRRTVEKTAKLAKRTGKGRRPGYRSLAAENRPTQASNRQIKWSPPKNTVIKATRSKTPRAKSYTRPRPSRKLIRWRLWDRTGGRLDGRIGQPSARRGRSIRRRGPRRQQTISACHRRLGRPAICSRPTAKPTITSTASWNSRRRATIPRTPMKNQNKIGVQYAAVNGNDFGGYGEIVYGTKRTLHFRTRTGLKHRSRSYGRRQHLHLRRQARRTRHPSQRLHRRDRRQGRRRHGRKSRLQRRNRTLGLVHPQSGPRKQAPLPSRGGPVRRGNRPCGKHLRPRRPAHPIQGRVVRHR